jgi:aminopeptidase
VDERWNRLADILVNYSTRTRLGDRVLITMMEPETMPLVQAVYTSVVKAGGYPQVQFTSAYLDRSLLQYGSDDQVRWVPELEQKGMEWADVYIGLRGARNPYELSDIPAGRLVEHRRALGVVSSLRNERTRWVLIRVPNEAFAQQAGTSLGEIIEFFFAATLRDWEAEAREYRRIRERFQAVETVRILGKETDLRFSTKGRTYVVGDGTHNMPDGEIYTAPVEDGVSGRIFFEFPGVYSGFQIPGIRLVFRDGSVQGASATAREDLLQHVLKVDRGASRVGEFGVGLNFGIDRFVSDILYDEKIGGTIHLALGRAYTECGGVNESAIHWDIVKDLRRDGAILLDGKEVFANGRFKA